MPHPIPILIAAVSACSGVSVVNEEVQVAGDFLRIEVDPSQGGAMTKLGFVAKEHNLAGPEGLLVEGFGVGSPYVPNRRLNERMEIVDDIPDRPQIRFSYDCDGPNIKGLHSQRTVEPMLHDASIRVTWTVENRGAESQWVAPWVRNTVAPGGTVDAQDRLDVPTLHGIRRAERTAIGPASRNWIAATDPLAKETVYGVFNADQLYAFTSIVEPDDGMLGFTAHFIPNAMDPGETWTTTYRISAVRGLTQVDFATDEFAVQMGQDAGMVRALISATCSIAEAELYASVLGLDAAPRSLGGKRFSIAPDQLVRCSYEFKQPTPGAYDFLAQLKRGGQNVDLGKDTHPPHGGIDTQILVGSVASPHLEPWTDAPFALDRGPRTLERAMAIAGDTAIWFEPSISKIFREDIPKAVGAAQPKVRVALAKNERESFQVVIRPPKGNTIEGAMLKFQDLADGSSGAVLDAARIATANVGYVPVRVPTHFEGPTGLYPDPLPPATPFTAKGGECSPIWVTVHAPKNQPAGRYTGLFELHSANADPIELTLEVTVLDFALPDTPAMKTDFGLRVQDAVESAKQRGYKGTESDLVRAFLANARDHRVTLRSLGQMPIETADYAAALKGYAEKLPELRAAGVSTINVPVSLLDSPDQLRLADAFVVEHGLKEMAFATLSAEPLRPAWPRLLDSIARWREAAPNIPVTVSTSGLDPFLAEDCRIWTIHSQVLDTANGKPIVEFISAGREVWWYVSGMPPRPYGNLFVDFAAIEHRILFWQAWALGIKGMQYRGINQPRGNADPYDGLLDETPANGDAFLVYPGAAGPVNSIRWETIRDGIEDYDYLVLLRERIAALQDPDPGLLARVKEVANLQAIVPDLVSFSRDPGALLRKREEIGRMIVELDKALVQ